MLFSRCAHGPQEFRGKSAFRGVESYSPVQRLVRNSATHLSEPIKLAKTANNVMSGFWLLTKHSANTGRYKSWKQEVSYRKHKTKPKMMEERKMFC